MPAVSRPASGSRARAITCDGIVRLCRHRHDRGVDLAQNFAIVGHPARAVLRGDIPSRRFVRFGHRDQPDSRHSREDPHVMSTQRARRRQPPFSVRSCRSPDGCGFGGAFGGCRGRGRRSRGAPGFPRASLLAVDRRVDEIQHKVSSCGNGPASVSEKNARTSPTFFISRTTSDAPV